ncbi:hypothetical protein HK102_007705, partial [Quaeritorhiza haematococci]
MFPPNKPVLRSLHLPSSIPNTEEDLSLGLWAWCQSRDFVKQESIERGMLQQQQESNAANDGALAEMTNVDATKHIDQNAAIWLYRAAKETVLYGHDGNAVQVPSQLIPILPPEADQEFQHQDKDEDIGDGFGSISRGKAKKGLSKLFKKGRSKSLGRNEGKAIMESMSVHNMNMEETMTKTVNLNRQPSWRSAAIAARTPTGPVDEANRVPRFFLQLIDLRIRKDLM